MVLWCLLGELLISFLISIRCYRYSVGNCLTKLISGSFVIAAYSFFNI